MKDRRYLVKYLRCEQAGSNIMVFQKKLLSPFRCNIGLTVSFAGFFCVLIYLMNGFHLCRTSILALQIWMISLVVQYFLHGHVWETYIIELLVIDLSIQIIEVPRVGVLLTEKVEDWYCQCAANY